MRAVDPKCLVWVVPGLGIGMALMDRHTLLMVRGFLGSLFSDECSQEPPTRRACARISHVVGSEVRPVFFPQPLWVGIGDRLKYLEFRGFSEGDRTIYEGFDPGSE